jgi:hypothetical protein
VTTVTPVGNFAQVRQNWDLSRLEGRAGKTLLDMWINLILS